MKSGEQSVKNIVTAMSVDDKLSSFGILFSKNPLMQNIFRAAKNQSAQLSPILIEGESGSGKKALALEIHNHKKSLSTLYFYDEGFDSFKYRNSKDTTLIIENVDRLDRASQTELLAYLKWQKESLTGARIIATSVSYPSALIPELLFLLSRVHLKILPLRERREDILPFIDFFSRKFSQGEKCISNFSSSLLSKLLDYSWPLNLSELKEEVYYLIKKHASASVWNLEMTSMKISGNSSTYVSSILKSHAKLQEALEELEKKMIADSLKKSQGNKSKACKELGISRSGLIQKVEKYGLASYRV